jgi:hypothetical protein
MKETLLLITPHMSTGGCPQVVTKKVELLKDTYNIVCVEWECIAWSYVVQRNKVINLLGENFVSLGENKEYELFNLIEDINPKYIMIEELSETFIPNNILKRLYKSDREYKIIETTHSSYSTPESKKFLPDKFIFVCEHSGIVFKDLGVPYDVIEYPIDIKERNQLECQEKLGLDPEWKHVINIGLFTSGKNQGYIFDMCRKLEEYKIKFHFIGNQAGNFEDYWKPLMDSKPENCVVWGERDDVDTFIQSSDLFLFPSLLELNPISIKEVLEYEIPSMFYNLPIYYNKYDNLENITMLTGNIDTDCENLLSIINPKLNEKSEETPIVEQSTEMYHSLVSLPNIKLAHLLLDLEYRADIPSEKWQSNIDRQNKSVECFSKVANKFSSYTQIFSKVNRSFLPKESSMYPEIVKESLEDSIPPHLSYGHYGGYNAHKRATIQEFSEELDALVIIESDVAFDVSPEEFHKIVIEGYELGRKHNAGLITFAGSKWYSKWSDYPSLVEDIDERWEKVPHFLIGSMYMIFKNEKENFKQKYETSGWHSPDIWIAENFHNQTVTLSLKNPLVYQVTGYSLIDYRIKNTEGNYLD